MKKTKNSRTAYNPRTKSKTTNRSTSKNPDSEIFNYARKSILTVIIVAMLAVILALLLAFFQNPERLVKQKLNDITSDYYESYFYPNLIGNSTDDESLNEIMSRYTEPGFSNISLRQLLLFDNERYAKTAAFLKNYCDENKTFAHIYPEAPFGKKNYRIKFTYSCTF